MQIQYSYEHISNCRKPRVRNCSRKRKGLYNGNVQQNPLCAVSCATKGIPISPQFPPTFLIAGQIQHRTVHSFLYTPAQVDAPCRLEAHYARNKKMKKMFVFLKKNMKLFCIAQRHFSPSMFLHVLLRMYSSSTFYAQNLVLEIVDQQKSVNVIYTYMCKGNVEQKNLLCAASCVTKNIYPRWNLLETYVQQYALC